MLFDGALFDYDGTLADTDSVHHACWNDCLSPFRLRIDDSFYSRHCCGAVSTSIARSIISHMSLSDVRADELAAEKDRRYSQWIADRPVSLMPGVRQALHRLKQAGMRIGIVTGAPQDAIAKSLQDEGILDFFEVMITRECVQHGKPHPQGYLQAADRLQLPPRRLASFEDTASGVAAAKEAGTFSVAVPSRYTRQQDFRQADLVCGNLLEAVALMLERPR